MSVWIAFLTWVSLWAGSVIIVVGVVYSISFHTPRWFVWTAIIAIGAVGAANGRPRQSSIENVSLYLTCAGICAFGLIIRSTRYRVILWDVLILYILAMLFHNPLQKAFGVLYCVDCLVQDIIDAIAPNGFQAMFMAWLNVPEEIFMEDWLLNRPNF